MWVPADFYSMILHSQLENDKRYTVKLLVPSPEALRRVSETIDGMKIDQTWICTELRPWETLSTSERHQYPTKLLLDPEMLQSLRLSLMQPGTCYLYLLVLLSLSRVPEKIRALDRQIADLMCELAGYKRASGTSGSKEKIQVVKLVNEFLQACRETAPPTTNKDTPGLLKNNIQALRDIMSKRNDQPTVPQMTSAVSACFAPLFQRLSSTHQELEAIKDELATVKATNEELQQQVDQHSFDNHLRTPVTQSIELQSEIDALKRQISEDQARLVVVSQENKKLRAQNSELKGKVRSFRENARLSEEVHSVPASGGGVEPPDVQMLDSTISPQDRDMELPGEQELLIRLLEGEKNMRLGVELELADLKAEYELQEEMMLDWFLESVRVTNGEAYLKQLKMLKEMRPMPPSKSRDSY